MKAKHCAICLPLVAALVVSLAAGLSPATPEQGGPPGQRGPGQNPDPLRPLNIALQRAGAPAVTPDQAQRILALVRDFRSAARPAPPTETVRQARISYETAILNGDLAAARAQIPTLAAEQAGNAPERMKGEAALAINILQVLQTNGDQLALLRKSMNDSQLARLLLSFAGAGGPGPGPGPGRGGRNPISR